eukprot:7566298-Pyramimonas_sp.AAC.1
MRPSRPVACASGGSREPPASGCRSAAKLSPSSCVHPPCARTGRTTTSAASWGAPALGPSPPEPGRRSGSAPPSASPIPQHIGGAPP